MGKTKRGELGLPDVVGCLEDKTQPPKKRDPTAKRRVKRSGSPLDAYVTE